VRVRKGVYRTIEELEALIEDFPLASFGNEALEAQEIKSRPGWRGCGEAGKFYDDRGSWTWYYFAYGDSREAREPAVYKGMKAIRRELVVSAIGPDRARVG
jgi:hypothetical protein